MTVSAVLKDGTVVELAESVGDTPEAVLEKLHGESLTGSAAAAESIWLSTAQGGVVRFSAVDRLEQAQS